MERYVLGIDIGTGSIKAVAVNENGKALTTAQAHHPTASPQPGFSEQDPETIWAAFVSSVRQVINACQQPPQAVCLSSAMHSVIPVDNNGTALYPLITWADTRSTDIAERLRASADATVYERTGTPIHSMTPLCKIIWLKEQQPQLFSQTAKFISIKEYIWFKLFGEFKIDYSIATATGLFNIRQLQWDEEALALAGITKAHLAEPVSTLYRNQTINSTIAAALGTPADTTFVIGASDGCMANVGSFALEPGIAALTIGTSGAVRIASPKPIVDTATMIFSYFLEKDVFICGGPVNNGGNAVDWLLKSFLNQPTVTAAGYKSMFLQIETVPAGSDGLLFLPYLYGERAPIWDGKSSGAYIGIRASHHQAYFLRAAVEGICYALNEVLQVLESATQPVQQVNVSGGFIHSHLWMQILADITGKRLALVQTEDASTVGAALFAMKALMWIADYKSVTTDNITYLEPNGENHRIYQQYFAIFKESYLQLKTTMHQLYALRSSL